MSFEAFEIADVLKIESNEKGVPFGIVGNNLCNAKFSLLGGHVCEFTPHDFEPILFVSEASHFEVGKAIRGGIPVCFPWFGPARDAEGQVDSAKPSHGLVRTELWELVSSNHSDAGTEVAMQFTTEDFRVTNSVTFGKTLELDFKIENLRASEQAFELGLHTYFSVGDAAKVEIRGLEQTPFLDQLTGETHPGSGHPIRFTEETDRIYHGAVKSVQLHDPAKSREIVISSSGSNSTVVWNPWIAKSKRMADFGYSEYPFMCCIETANIGDNSIVLAGRENHSMALQISASKT